MNEDMILLPTCWVVLVFAAGTLQLDKFVGQEEVELSNISINLLVVYRESVNLIDYITRRLSADSLQLWIANENRSPIYFDQSRSVKF